MGENPKITFGALEPFYVATYVVKETALPREIEHPHNTVVGRYELEDLLLAFRGDYRRHQILSREGGDCSFPEIFPLLFNEGLALLTSQASVVCALSCDRTLKLASSQPENVSALARKLKIREPAYIRPPI